MAENEIKFNYLVFEQPNELTDSDRLLLEAGTKALAKSYAPYSNFKVGAAALLENGEMVTAGNQENASYPAGICAESAALMAASSFFPGTAVTAIAITAKAQSKILNHPIAPCGICRQRMLEWETHFNRPIALILMGETGKVYKINSIKDMLPLHFSSQDL